MHILHAPEPLKADLSKSLILRTCGMAHSYYSLAWQGYTCWSGEEHMHCIGDEHHAELSRVSVTRQAKAVAHMWDGPELSPPASYRKKNQSVN